MVNKGKSIPFIHVFRTSVGNYFYDVNKKQTSSVILRNCKNIRRDI